MSNIETLLINLFQDSQINVFVAFGAGFLTFFASCLLPLLPTYLMYISGLSLAEVQDAKGKLRLDIVINAIIFTMGFTLTFVILGLVSNKIYSNVIQYKDPIQLIIGVIFVILGLYNLEIIKLPISTTNLNIDTRKLLTKWSWLNSLIIGLALGLAWTPCIGPVLGVILFWSSQAETYWKGTSLLIAFGFGMGVPFIIAGIGAGTIIDKIKKLTIIKKMVFGLILIQGLNTIINTISNIYKNWY